MYTVILTASSLCLLGQETQIQEKYKFAGKPTFREVELLQRKFALAHNVELDMIQVDVVRNEIKPLG